MVPTQGFLREIAYDSIRSGLDLIPDEQIAQAYEHSRSRILKRLRSRIRLDERIHFLEKGLAGLAVGGLASLVDNSNNPDIVGYLSCGVILGILEDSSRAYGQLCMSEDDNIDNSDYNLLSELSYIGKKLGIFSDPMRYALRFASRALGFAFLSGYTGITDRPISSGIAYSLIMTAKDLADAYMLRHKIHDTEIRGAGINRNTNRFWELYDKLGN